MSKRNEEMFHDHFVKYANLSRRSFLKGALAIGGALALAGCGETVTNTVVNTVTVTDKQTVTVTDKQTVTVTDTKTVTVTEKEPVEAAPTAKYVVTKPSVILANYADCAGCRYCIAACTDRHYQEYSLNKSNIQVYSIHAGGGVIDVPIMCVHCNDAPCIEACPDKVAAISIDEVTGARIIDHEKCTLCEKCVEACDEKGVGCLRVSNEQDRIVGMCDMCGGTPACMEICPEDLFMLAQDTDRFNATLVQKPEEIAARVAEIIFTV